MDKVKSDSKNVHSKRSLFFNVGLVIALVFCFIAFEFKVYISDEERVELPDVEAFTLMPEDIKPTIQKPKPKPIIPSKQNQVLKITETKTEEVIAAPEVLDIASDEIDDLFVWGALATEKVEDPTIHIFVESQPQYKGGMDKFYKYLKDNIEYPRREKSIGVDGKVYLQFVIERDGSITDIQVLKGVSEGLDKEAVRVLNESPKWEPGSNRGQPVRVRMTIPISFQLN